LSTGRRCEAAILVSFQFVSSVFLSTFSTSCKLTQNAAFAPPRRHGAHYRAFLKWRKREYEDFKLTADLIGTFSKIGLNMLILPTDPTSNST
ncbi:MAG: hypothetical protein KKB45_12535, partial [Gammaproteobacteria bacterium]|nr:hypothetical protein [Gammaproteobacteria bacterium]